MKLSILADPEFGWSFIFGQIIVIYLAFLYIHRKVEVARKKKEEDGSPMRV